MRDRITAVDGKLTIDSIPGRGTSVDGTVPDPWQDATPDTAASESRHTPPPAAA